MNGGLVEVVGVAGEGREALAVTLAQKGWSVSVRTPQGEPGAGPSPLTVALLAQDAGAEVRPLLEALLVPALRGAAGHRRLVVVRRRTGDASPPGGDWVDALVRSVLGARRDAVEAAGVSTHFVRYLGPAAPDGALWADDLAGALGYLDRLAPRVALPELALERVRTGEQR